MKLNYIFLILFSNFLFGQEYQLFQKYKGDINGDGKRDEIRVFEKKCGEENVCRKIEIYLYVNKKLKLIDENTKLLSCTNCYEYYYPFSGIEFGYKTFSVNFLLGDCDKTYYGYEFKINSKNKFMLDQIKAGMGVKIFRYLHLDELGHQVALTINADSKKIGKKD